MTTRMPAGPADTEKATRLWHSLDGNAHKSVRNMADVKRIAEALADERAVVWREVLAIAAKNSCTPKGFGSNGAYGAIRDILRAAEQGAKGGDGGAT